MHIVIDGYNILKQALHQGNISESQRRAFINLLGKYAIKKNHKIMIVFDGGQGSWPFQEKDHGVSVLYSGTTYTADDCIKKYAQERKFNCLIVTSDNEIKQWAQAHNIITIEALEFYSLVREQMQVKPMPTIAHELIKTSLHNNALIDELMYQYTKQVPYKEEANESQNRTPTARALTKKEREYLKKIKKL